MNYLIAENGDCLSLALKRRCKNAIKRQSRRKHHARRCEINFLPFVYLEHNQKQNPQQKRYNFLRCWQGLSGYSRCPDLRDEKETKELICNPFRDNTKRCTTTHGMVHTRCNIFEICDQAVLISGGWNRETTGTRFQRNLERMNRMLLANGFTGSHIKTFFANGASGINGKFLYQRGRLINVTSSLRCFKKFVFMCTVI